MRPALRPIEDVEAEAAAPIPEPRVDWRDGIAAVGLLLLVGGIAQIYVPAAWITLGSAMLFVAWRS